MAQSFPCSNASASPYPTLVTTDHDHRRIAPVGSSLTKAFTAYYSSFDEGGEKDGEATHVLRLNPQCVSYELRGVGPDANGDYAEPPVSIGRPNHWYTSPELIPLVDSIQGVTNRRIDDSYRRWLSAMHCPVSLPKSARIISLQQDMNQNDRILL